MKIILKEERYEKTESGKCWKSKPFETEIREITKEHYENYTNERTQQFFRRLGGSETAIRSYTRYGYRITSLTSCNPDRTLKVKRNFTFEV